MSADAVPGEEYCSQPVATIVFSGNRVTKDQVLLREVEQRIDEECSLDKIVDSMLAIMDLGLFRFVLVDLALVDEQLQLRFTVKEKIFFLLVPRISRTSDRELRGGLQLRFDNFLGRLHEVRITSERREEDDGAGDGGFVHKLNYKIPRFLNSNYGFGFELSSDRRQETLERNGNEFGTGQSETQRAGLLFSRFQSRFQGVQGIRVIFGARVSRRDLDITTGGAGPFTGGTDVGLIFGIEKKDVSFETYRRSGVLYGAQLTFANESFGSDFEYTRADLYANAYIPLRRGIRNVNVQMRLGISDGAAFGEHSYSIGGGEKLRGLPSGSATGDTLALLNVEYLHAWYDFPQWRGVLFTDIGNVYSRENSSFPALKLRAGFGIRRKLLSVSNTDIRLDVAWDPKGERVRTILSSSLTF